MKKKSLALVLCLSLLAVAVIGGTMAYFTDTDQAQNVFTVGAVGIDLTEPTWDQENANIMPGKVIKKDPTVTVDADSQDCWLFLKIDMNKYVSLLNLIGVDAYKNNIGGLTGDYPGLSQFLGKLVSDNALRAKVLDRWFQGIDHENWKVMNLDEIQAAIEAAAGGTNPAHIAPILGYQGGVTNGILKANDEVTFMKSFIMPATVTQSMMDGDDAYYVGEGEARHSASNFNTKKAEWKLTFTAYAIQAEGLDTLDAAYKAMFSVAP